MLGTWYTTCTSLQYKLVVYQVPNLQAAHHYAKMVRLCLCSVAILATKTCRFHLPYDPVCLSCSSRSGYSLAPGRRGAAPFRYASLAVSSSPAATCPARAGHPDGPIPRDSSH
jgi:hypothetical protein